MQQKKKLKGTWVGQYCCLMVRWCIPPASTVRGFDSPWHFLSCKQCSLMRYNCFLFVNQSLLNIMPLVCRSQKEDSCWLGISQILWTYFTLQYWILAIDNVTEQVKLSFSSSFLGNVLMVVSILLNNRVFWILQVCEGCLWSSSTSSGMEETLLHPTQGEYWAASIKCRSEFKECTEC